jgi:ribonuclease R
MRDRRRIDEGFLEISLPEVRVLCTEHPPRILGLRREEPNPAHALVEEFMLAANSAVAGELQARKIPGLYRNHDDPSPADLAEFADWVEPFYGRRPTGLQERDGLLRFLDGIGDLHLREVVLGAFLRTMKRAGYGSASTGHFGLGKLCYCHFTSPIRRYPDLLVHQQLQAYDTGAVLRTEEAVGEIGGQCTAAEANNDAAYYAASDRLKMRFLARELLDAPVHTYEGVVARVFADGLLVYLEDAGLYGKVGSGSLRGDFRRDRRRRKLRSASSGKSYKAGDIIHVRVRRADPVRGVLELEPVQARV